nr:hypothetical protein [Tanacetum cinerariifolium]
TRDERLETVEVKVSSFDGISFRSRDSLISMSLICCFSSLISLDNPTIFEGSSFSLVGKQLAKSCEANSLDNSGFREVTKTLSYKIKVSRPEPVTLELEMILKMEEGLKELGVKKVDLVSFKISAKSSSFTFHEMSSAPDSLFTLEVVWADFNLSLADLILSTRTLGLDPVTSIVKYAKASCPDADSECKMKEVDQAGWLRLASMAELELVSFFEWIDWDLDALVVDSDVCFEDCFLLGLLLALGFLPWGTSLVGDEYLGSLESTCTTKLQMAFTWLMNGGFSGAICSRRSEINLG